MNVRLPLGKGMFVWLVDRLLPKSGGSVESLADVARAINLDWVAVKIADGVNAFYGTYNKSLGDLTAKFSEALKQRGIRVWGWHYVYGVYPVAEAGIAKARMRELGLEGYIIDAEAEYKYRSKEAVAFLQALRTRDFPIALCSFRYPNLHREFPFEVFMSVVDANMPQVYWVGSQNAGYQLRNSLLQYRRFRDVPFIPVGAAYQEHGWRASPASIKDFMATAKELGLPGYSFWEWYHALIVYPELGQAIFSPSNGGDGNMRRVITPYTNLRVRTAPSLSASVKGYLRPNVPYTLVKQEGLWGYLREVDGWVYLTYTKSY